MPLRLCRNPGLECHVPLSQPLCLASASLPSFKTVSACISPLSRRGWLQVAFHLYRVSIYYCFLFSDNSVHSFSPPVYISVLISESHLYPHSCSGALKGLLARGRLPLGSFYPSGREFAKHCSLGLWLGFHGILVLPLPSIPGHSQLWHVIARAPLRFLSLWPSLVYPVNPHHFLCVRHCVYSVLAGLSLSL